MNKHTLSNRIISYAGRIPNLTLLSPKPLNRSIQNFARLIMSARLRTVPKIITIGRTGAPPIHRPTWNIMFGVLFSAFLGSCTTRTECRTKVNDGLKFVFSVQEVPFWVPLMTSVRKGSKPPKSAQFFLQRGIPSITKILNSLSYVRV